jgi:Ca2+-binding RTX toxin-like protein
LFDSTPGKSSPDVIKDFKPGTDHILLDHSAFEGIGPVGALSAALFDVGSEALGANTRILYDSENGLLLYDKDGTGGSKGLVFAKLDSGLDIGAGDFLIV